MHPPQGYESLNIRNVISAVVIRMATAPFRIGEAFKPAPQFKTYTYAYLGLMILIAILPWLIPVILVAPLPVAAGTLSE